MNNLTKIGWQNFFKEVEYKKGPDRETGWHIILGILILIIIALAATPR